MRAVSLSQRVPWDQSLAPYESFTNGHYVYFYLLVFE